MIQKKLVHIGLQLLLSKANIYVVVSILIYRISSRDATLLLLLIDLSSNTMAHLG